MCDCLTDWGNNKATTRDGFASKNLEDNFDNSERNRKSWCIINTHEAAP